MKLIDPGDVRPLKARGITAETCEHFGYTVGTYRDKPVQIAPYYDATGQLVAQKVRFKDKDFKLLGSLDDALPFGAKAFPKSGRMIVVTEGEIDALSMSQAQGNKWPVVSIACGAGPQVRKYIAKHRDYFLGFEKVVLMFDNDEPGREAAKIAAEVLGSVAHIAELPLKDANEMLVADRADELITAMWRAKPYRPDGIVALSDIMADVLTEEVQGKDWSLPSLTALTYGRRAGEVWVLGAGTGTGKTDFLLQESAYVITHHKEPVGLFFLEATPKQVARRLAGKVAHKAFHVPDGSWTEEELRTQVEALGASGLVFLYDNYGVSEWDLVKERMRYLRHAHDVRYFVVDNLTAFAGTAEDERRELERVMAEVAGLAQELDAFIWVVSHLATPDGTPHENGGVIMLRHLKGSRAIAAWAHGALGLERDQQAEDLNERHTSTVRVLKDRFSGRATGSTFRIKYDSATGVLYEVGPPGDAEEFGFSPEGAPAGSGAPSDF